MEQNINKQNKRTFAEIAREIKQTWRGEDARRIKAELKSMIK